MRFSIKYILVISSSVIGALFLWGGMAFAVISCTNDQQNNEPVEQYFQGPDNNCFQISEIDSCEYIFYTGYYETAITHHGNCKFCKARKL